jgi:hypothetical protein
MNTTKLNEGGLRNINALAKRYKKAEIYFHQDLDGVTTAIAMKAYLERYGIKVVDAHIIQYGDKEFAIKKLDAKGDTMPVLVDFAHGKPMFVIHTDHHDRQAGAGDTKSTSFRASRSNVETISQSVSPSDIFMPKDILLISTVDSANFAQYDITPDQVVNYIYKLDKGSPVAKNKMLLGFVINKLLLAFKNKEGFLEGLVLDSNPSLMNILKNISKWMKANNAPLPAELQKNADTYREKMKDYGKKDYKDGVIFQMGGGSMVKAGSYDRYTPFRNNPDADFLIMVWPMGLVQASCNPFKKGRELKGVNLGDIAQDALNVFGSKLKSLDIKLSTIKKVSEFGKDFDQKKSVGFTFADFKALYGDKYKLDGGKKLLDIADSIMQRPYKSLSPKQIEMLDKISVTAWDLIQANSGGHKCITNISGLNYLGKADIRPSGDYGFGADDSIPTMIGKVLQAKLHDEIKK